MKIISLSLNGLIPVNSYICFDETTRCGVIIDPGAEAERILSLLREKDISIEKILLTHGHFDHLGAAAAVSQATGAPICMGECGAEYAANPAWNLSAMIGQKIILSEITTIAEGEIVPLNNAPSVQLTVIATPGHTLDGTVYYAAQDNVAFVGDTIFAGSHGRTDLYGGDEKILLQSIKEKILTLPPTTVLLSGHSEPTDVAQERKCPWYR